MWIGERELTKGNSEEVNPHRLSEQVMVNLAPLPANTDIYLSLTTLGQGSFLVEIFINQIACMAALYLAIVVAFLIALWGLWPMSVSRYSQNVFSFVSNCASPCNTVL